MGWKISKNIEKGFIEDAFIGLDINGFYYKTLLHKFAHAFINPLNHPENNFYYNTCTYSPSYLKNPSDLDIQISKLLYENTFNPEGKLENILGFKWYNEK